MLTFCKPDQGAARDRHLQRYLLRGKKMVDECAVAITKIKDSFASWSSKTNDLFRALEEATGSCP